MTLEWPWNDLPVTLKASNGPLWHNLLHIWQYLTLLWTQIAKTKKKAFFIILCRIFWKKTFPISSKFEEFCTATVITCYCCFTVQYYVQGIQYGTTWVAPIARVNLVDKFEKNIHHYMFILKGVTPILVICFWKPLLAAILDVKIQNEALFYKQDKYVKM